MDRIAPSILSADFARLGEEVRAVIAAGVDRTLQLIRAEGCQAGGDRRGARRTGAAPAPGGVR